MAHAYSEHEVQLATVYAELSHLREASSDLLNWIDYSDATTFNKEDGTTTSGYTFDYQTALSQALMRPSATACYYLNETQLRMLRARSRALASINPYWQAVIHNKIAYIVGSGHNLTVAPKRSGKSVDEDLRFKVLDELEKFSLTNRYRHRQGEKWTRLDRDGEYFLRYFEDAEDGILRVRFVEPLLVQTPPGMTEADNVWFGIQFRNTDYEEAVRYYIRSTTYDGGTNADLESKWRTGVDAKDIQHRKANVDMGSPRGVPTTYALHDQLTQAVSTLKSMGRLVDIRARVAMIRKQINATLGQITPILNANRSGQVSNSAGQLRNAFGLPYGTIIDTNDQREYLFPSQNIETDKIVASLKSDLQCVASAVGLADFCISGDSKAAFANALVKEGPMDRAIGLMQQDMIEDDMEVYNRALSVAAENGRLPGDILDQVRIEIMPPNVIARDRLVNTQADEILVRAGAMSSETMSTRWNLDPEQEREKIKKNPSPEQAAALGNNAQNQPGLAKQASGRGVPAGKETGPSVNPRREGLEEGAYEPHSQDSPSQAEMAMASVLVTPDWIAKTKAEILSLPITAGSPKDSGIRMEYELGVQGVYLGIVDQQKVWAVDADAIMVKHDAHDFVVAGNHMRWAWIPDDVILVDWSYAPSAMAHDLYHEAVETRLMSLGRWSYAMAHRIANSLEREWMLELRPDLAAIAQNSS